MTGDTKKRKTLARLQCTDFALDYEDVLSADRQATGCRLGLRKRVDSLGVAGGSGRFVFVSDTHESKGVWHRRGYAETTVGTALFVFLTFCFIALLYRMGIQLDVSCALCIDGNLCLVRNGR